jgi:hypothetical protein
VVVFVTFWGWWRTWNIIGGYNGEKKEVEGKENSKLGSHIFGIIKVLIDDFGSC